LRRRGGEPKLGRPIALYLRIRVAIGVSTAGAGHFEDVIDLVDDGEVFVLGYLALRIELLELGLFFGQVVIVFSEAESFAVEAGECVEEANVVERVWFEFALLQDTEDFGESDLDECFLEFGAAGEFGHVGAVFAEDTKLVAPFLVAEILLVAVVFPAGNVDFEKFVRKGRIG
jgi:hypothetical protein